MKHFGQLVRWLTLVGLPLLCWVTAPAQFTEGTIVGHVSDSSGAAVVGAKVQVTNVSTGISTETETDSSGFYRALHLQPGNYSVTVTAAGFKKTVLENIQVNVNNTTRADAQLKPGQVVETVEVTGAAALVQTEEGRLSDTVTSQEVNALPLNGRQVYQLAYLEPGVTSTSAKVVSSVPAPTSSVTFDFGFIANGSTPRGNNFRLDGTPNNNEWLGGTPLVYPSLEAVEEMQVQTLNYSAEYGRNNGAIINIITKSGSNKFHGTVFYTGRNSALDASNWFDKVKKTPLQQNQFGASFGGPIIQDKTFFFLNYEGARRKYGTPAAFTVETPAYRQSVISGSPNSIAALLFSDFPAPDCVANIGTLQCETFASQIEHASYDEHLVRLDHHFGAKDSVFTRWVGAFASGNVAAEELQGAGIRGFTAPFDGFFGSLGIGETHQFSIHTLNDLRFAFGRNNSNISFGMPSNTKTAQLLKSAGHPLSDFGWLYFDDGTVGIGGEFFVPRNFVFNTYSINETLFHTVAEHSLKIGFEFTHVQENSDYRLYSSPFYEFLSIGTGFFGAFGSDSPYSTVATVNRVPGSPRFGQFTDTPRHFRWNRWAAFVQDDWKVRPRLTVNLGLRWDVFASPNEENGLLSNIILGPGTSLTQQIAGATAGRVRKLWDTDYKNVAPRIGLAWDPRGNGKLAIRSGFSIAYNEAYSNLYTNASRLDPPDANTAIVNLLGGYGTTTNYVMPPFQPSPDFAAPTLANGGIQGVQVFPNGVDPHLKTAYAMQWFGGLQQSLHEDWAIMLNYVGTRGVGGYTREDYNRFNGDICNVNHCNYFATRLNPGWGQITYISNESQSIYHGLNAGLKKRPTHGLSMTANYTWGKVLDNVTEGGLGDYINTNGYGLLYSGVSNIENQRMDRGPSEFDVAHRFVFSALWNLPGPKGGGLASRIVAGWSLNTVVSLQSGRPFDVYCGQPWFNGCDFNMDNLNYDRPNRPVGIKTSGFSNAQFENGVFGDPSLTFSASTFSRGSQAIQVFCPDHSSPFSGLNSILDYGPVPSGPGAQCVPVGENGNLSRNAFRGPAMKDVDLSLVKDIQMVESVKLQFRAEAFNLFNRVNLYNPIGDMSLPAFGQSTAAFDAREIQLTLKLTF
jgi:outer membrane receptor protein involved in Fe transport